MAVIYCIRDTENSEIIYVGKTVNFSSRKSQHFRKNNNSVLGKYMRKFSNYKEKFRMEILKEVEDKVLEEEAKFIREFKPLCNFVYNKNKTEFARRISVEIQQYLFEITEKQEGVFAKN